jgi:predicted TIM-barrel fold metal-dependent hydrolase
MVVDSHTHVASPDTERYPLLPSGVGRDWWTGGDHSAPALVAALDGDGSGDGAGAVVDRAVVVQAVGPYGYDCRYAIDAATAFPDRLALVGAVDMAGPDPVAALADLAATAAAAPLRGVRLFGVDGNPPAWLTDGRAAAVWDMAGQLGCSIVATLFARDLPALRPLVEARPTVPVAVDHAGFPDLTGGPPYPGLALLLDLADLDAVHVKVSSHLLLDALAAGGSAGPADPADVVDRLAGAFGAARLAWGSDHPQTTDLGYPQMLDLARHATRRLPPSDADAVLHETATKLWWSAAR